MAILFEFISALFWGILSGLLVAIVVAYIMKEVFSVSRLYIAIAGLFLCFFLSFQFTTLIAAAKTKAYIKNVDVLVKTIDEGVNWREIETTYPILKPYLGKVTEQLETVTGSSLSIASYTIGVINGYMWRRVAWILGVLILTFVTAGILGTTQKPAPRAGNARSRDRGTPPRSRNVRATRR